MKQDKDLIFLASCQNDDLRTLCDILTYNNKVYDGRRAWEIDHLKNS